MADGSKDNGWIAPGSRGRWLIVLTGLTIVLSLWLGEIGTALVARAAPAGIVSFELAGSAQAAEAILASWSPAAREAAMLVQGIDFLYLLVYPAWLCLAAASCGLALGGRWRKTGRIVSRAVLVAAPLDAIENLALIRQLTDGAAELPARIAWLAAIPKFALVVGAGSFLTAALAALLLRRLRR